MADSRPPPPPPPPAPAPTTIAALSDDLLREIFLRLPDLTSLTRAAFACPAFLRAVRSSPAFRRRFRELHEPPLLALFLSPDMRAIVPAAAGKSSDIAAAFDGLLQDNDSSECEWRSESEPMFRYSEGCAGFVSRITGQVASYSPHSRTLSILYGEDNEACLEFHTLCPDVEERRPSRVVCVHRDHGWAWARVAVFSSHTMDWQVVLPDMDTETLLVGSHGSAAPKVLLASYRSPNPKVINGFVCWEYTALVGMSQFSKGIVVLNTATFQFFSMDLPPPLRGELSTFELGQTKDGKFCVISVLQCMLSVWLWATDSDGVDRFVLHKTISLLANVSEITECSEEADFRIRCITVIHGFAYLSLVIDNPHSPQWFLSFCLETAELNLLHKESQCARCLVDPYIMVSWPSSLIHGKEDSETRVTGNIYEDDAHMGTEEASPVLFTALQSMKEKLIDDGNWNFADIDSFLLDDERKSLVNTIATLESRLKDARNCVLRIGIEPKPNSMSGMEIVTSESESAAARDRVLRIGTESDSMEEMERVSCWQMCKGMLSRTCSRFFTG